MKTSIYRFLIVLGMFAWVCSAAWAVAPLPGLDLVEPIRKRAPFTILSHDAHSNVQKIVARRTPNINLAPKGLLILVNYTDITFDENACGMFTAMHKGEELMKVHLGVPGMHNVSNALATIALITLMQLPQDALLLGLRKFGGANRRFQYKGQMGGITVIDDYAHHPTEIRATLTAAANYPHDRLVLVFQPHTYSRTHAFLGEFAEVLSLADVVVLADIYAAREKNTIGITSKDLLAKLKEKGTECYYFPSFEEIEKFLLKNCINGDLLITMGAGNVVDIGESLLGR
jgi:UDP-N-acetylmuramate--alanine ligase